MLKVKGLLRIISLAGLVFLFPLPASGAETSQEPLVLGVHPYLPATELLERFTPLAQYLERELGRAVIVRVGRDYQDHIELVGKNGLDLAYMGPASYVLMVERYGKKPLLARLAPGGKPTFRGAVASRKESPYENLSDLRGARFAFGDPDSTMSHLVPRYMLLEAGVDVEDLGGYEFLSSHHNVALGVLMGDFDAGAVKEEVFYEYEDRGLRAIAWTPEISEHVFVASPGLPAETREALKDALLRLGGEPSGKKVLSAIKEGTTVLLPASDGDYDNLRGILRYLESRGGGP
jgi:phosphonate transport system substrate-binding protein